MPEITTARKAIWQRAERGPVSLAVSPVTAKRSFSHVSIFTPTESLSLPLSFSRWTIKLERGGKW